MFTWHLFFLILALVLFLVAAAKYEHPYASPGWLGLASLTAAFLVGGR